MRRRNFLKIAGLGAIALAIPGISMYSASVETTMTKIIKKEFHFLKLDEAGLNKFVADYIKAEGEYQRAFTQLKLKGYSLLNKTSEDSQRVRNLTTSYLLSTDFFQNKMDESKVVNYLGLYSPHKTPCANPFSAIYYPLAVS